MTEPAPQHQQLRRATGITPITQKKLLFALEATFIVRPVSIEGDFRGSALYFEDHAEVAVVFHGFSVELLLRPPQRVERLLCD